MAEQKNRREAEEPAVIFDPVDVFRRLVKSWKLILCLSLALGLFVCAGEVFFVTPQYSATAILYVLSPESVINVSSLQLGSALTGDFIKVFDMWEVHEAVLSNLRLDASYTAMRQRLSVTNSPGTRMLDITFTSPSPEEAAAAANEYARVASQYIQETMAIDQPNIMSRALPPANPVSPHPIRDTALGLIGGAVLGALFTVLRSLTDDQLKTPEDIRRYTDLPTLAVVPLDDESAVREAGKKQKRPRRKAS